MKIGIEQLHVYPCSLAVDMRELAEHRGANADEICGDMMISQRSFNPPWEDPVTTAVNAANALLNDDDRRAIKLLLVGSESGPDQEKALSTWVQRYVGLGDDCRNLEIKHACYAGTGAVVLAANWLAMQPEGTKALVITTDQSREHFGKPYEFVMGAGAVAILLSKTPDFLALELDKSGFYTHEVADLTRPTSRVEAGHSETSLLSYLDAVDITFERYCAAAKTTPTTGDELRALVPFQIYHAPFGGITRRAHRAIWRTLDDFSATHCNEDFNQRVAPTLAHNRRMGGTYASSIFVSMLGCVDAFGANVVGQRLGVYSYGSGSSAEFFSGVFGKRAVDVAHAAGLAAGLDARLDLGVHGYEAAERFRTQTIDQGDYTVPRDGFGDLFATTYAAQRRLVFTGMREFERQYAWSNGDAA
ncbi:MAG: hydroxymethylglutaryl-CoA synthase [bacterium]